MSLKTDLQAEASNKYLDDNGPWRQFIIDHIPLIQANSKTVYPDGTIMQKYRYNVQWYMSYNIVTTSIGWIFLLINDLASERDFYKSQVYYMPSDTYIDDLYHLFITTTSNLTGS